ncbi:hypothetical protein GJ496_000855 [Pomphorhynchus laevis]|nr:hypothetical protein GJ496_000855 [Pomphorhynchus laevis]
MPLIFLNRTGKKDELKTSLPSLLTTKPSLCYTFERWLLRTNNRVDIIQINCANINIITDSWTCKEDNSLFFHFDCIENVQHINSN